MGAAHPTAKAYASRESQFHEVIKFNFSSLFHLYLSTFGIEVFLPVHSTHQLVMDLTRVILVISLSLLLVVQAVFSAPAFSKSDDVSSDSLPLAVQNVLADVRQVRSVESSALLTRLRRSIPMMHVWVETRDHQSKGHSRRRHHQRRRHHHRRTHYGGGHIADA